MSEVKVEQSQSMILSSVSQVLTNNSLSIRIIGTVDDSWFSGKDIAKQLGYKQTDKAINDHVTDESFKAKLGDLAARFNPSNLEGLEKLGISMKGNAKNSIYINEAGVYAMAFGSTLPAAITFKTWVLKDVLPSIRKTGSYRVNAQLQSLQSELSNQRLLTDQSARIAEEQKKRIEDLRVQAEIDRLRAEDEKKALTLKHETEQKEKDEQLAIQREALKLKHDTCKKWEEKAINRDPPPKVHLMYLASTAQYMVENLWKVGGVECEAALPGRLNLYQSGHSESDPFYYAWRMPCHNFRAIEDEFWTINGRYRDKQGTKKEMIRMHHDDILRDLGRIMSRTELTINECVAEYPTTMKRAIEENGPVYPNLDEPKVKKIPKIDIAATAEIDTVKKELMKHIATRYPNYVFETDKNTTAITIEWKVIAPSFDIYTGTRTHWCKLTKLSLDGTKIVFIPRGNAP